MKCLIAEKRPDGTYQVTAYVNADGSPTITIYKDAQEAALAVPILSKTATGLAKDSDRVTVFLDDQGTIERTESVVFPTTKEEETVKVTDISESAKTAVVDLANDILTKEGKPEIGPKDPPAEEGEVVPK